MARVNPLLDRAPTKAKDQKLTAGHHPVLPIRQRRDLTLFTT
jgi:hypothetical protein